MKRRIVLKIMLMSLVITALFLYGCEQAVVGDETLVTFYEESCGLQSVSLDSIKSFFAKVDNYTISFPEVKDNPLYFMIQKNIKLASARFDIEIDDEWSDTLDVAY